MRRTKESPFIGFILLVLIVIIPYGIPLAIFWGLVALAAHYITK